MKDLRLLECAVVLDQHRRFARAAEAVRMTQPSFSRAIARLEAELGVRLFDRSTRRVEPTPEGLVVLERARQLLADASSFGQALADYRELRWGRVAVGAGPYPLELSVTEAVARLSAAHPMLQVEVLEGAWHEFAPRLLTGEMDMTVMETSVVAEDSRFIIEAVPPHPGCFFSRAGHPLAGRRDVKLAAVLAYPLVGVRLPRRLHALLHHGRRGVSVDPRSGDLLPQILTTSVAASRAVVSRTDGVGLAVPRQLTADIERGLLAQLDVRTDAIRTSYGIITVRDRTLSPAAQAMASMIRQVETDIARHEAGTHAARPPRRRSR